MIWAVFLVIRNLRMARGFWGIFFAIPLATFVKAVLNAWPRITEDPEPPEETQMPEVTA